MSVKASWFQIGLSGTANLNFHWRNLLDGVLRLTRGNAGAPIADVMLVKSSNVIKCAVGIDTSKVPQHVTRAFATIYTSPDWEIVLSFSCTSSTPFIPRIWLQDAGVYVEGVYQGVGANYSTVTATIPPNSRYQLLVSNGTPTMYSCVEFR